MACYHPVSVHVSDAGTVSFGGRSSAGRALRLPCGQCIGCRLELSRQWAMRCMDEASLHKRNCALLLTYAPDKLPDCGALRYRDVQLFHKRLRKALDPFRFYMCGEYGTKNLRPHYHELLFGLDFDDKRFLGKSPAGSKLFSSKTLQSLWPHGHCSVGEANFKMAAYIARHNLAKVNGPLADCNYQRIDFRTGELTVVPREFNQMSRRPGIGAAWFEKYWSDIFPLDRAIVNGREVRPPKYYDNLYKRLDRQSFEELKERREFKGLQGFFDSTPRRLTVRELVAKARLKFLKRDYS